MDTKKELTKNIKGANKSFIRVTTIVLILLLLSSMMTPVISEEPITPKNLRTNSITTKLESAKTGDSKIEK